MQLHVREMEPLNRKLSGLIGSLTDADVGDAGFCEEYRTQQQVFVNNHTSNHTVCEESHFKPGNLWRIPYQTRQFVKNPKNLDGFCEVYICILIPIFGATPFCEESHPNSSQNQACPSSPRWKIFDGCHKHQPSKNTMLFLRDVVVFRHKVAFLIKEGVCEEIIGLTFGSKDDASSQKTWGKKSACTKLYKSKPSHNSSYVISLFCVLYFGIYIYTCLFIYNIYILLYVISIILHYMLLYLIYITLYSILFYFIYFLSYCILLYVILKSIYYIIVFFVILYP